MFASVPFSEAPMTAESRVSHEAAARGETHAALADLLVAYVDRAFVTAGQPGVLSTVRDLFIRMEPAALTALVYQLGLEVEPAREAEPEERRPAPG
jgi:precorrin-2 methylase